MFSREKLRNLASHCKMAGVRRPPVYRHRVKPFEDFDEVDFFQRYRVNKPVAHFICDAYSASAYGRLDERGHSIPDELMALTGIRYFASGSMYREVGDSHGVSRSTVVRAVKRMGAFLCEIADQWIKMPSTREEMFEIAEPFHRKYGMPRCVGAVDGTHIEIIAPSENEGQFVNRHWTHSLNIQASCDANLIFTSIDTTRPGSTHDNFMFCNSNLGEMCAAGELGNYFLLGDSAYALRPWIMAPYLRPIGRAQQRYNTSHRKARSVIERAFGRLKNRYRCLSRTGGDVQTTPLKVSKMVMACAVLHNIAEMARLPMPQLEDGDIDFEEGLNEDQEVDPADEEVRAAQVAGNAAGMRLRDALVRDVFSNPDALGQARDRYHL